MSAWTRTTPPTWFPTAVVGTMGWEHPTTGELLVAISNLAAKNGDEVVTPSIVGVTVNNEPLETGGSLVVVVEFDEAVAVVGVPTIELTIGLEAKNLFFDSANSTATHVAFSYEVTELDAATAGEVVVGTEIVVDEFNAVYDVLPGGSLVRIEDPVTFVSPDTTSVTMNAA